VAQPDPAVWDPSWEDVREDGTADDDHPVVRVEALPVAPGSVRAPTGSARGAESVGMSRTAARAEGPPIPLEEAVADALADVPVRA
jgi:hypothetical protein